MIMEIATTNFKKYLLDAYRELPEDIEINVNGEYHLLNDSRGQSYLIYVYDDMYQEYSYAILRDDVEWKTILGRKENKDGLG
jgi:hypothetical protein